MKILNWKQNDRGGARVGTFDLELPSGMTLIGCSLVNGQNGLFVGLPQRSYTKDGETKYVPTVSIEDKTIRSKFNASALDALRAEQIID